MRRNYDLNPTTRTEAVAEVRRFATFTTGDRYPDHGRDHVDAMTDDDIWEVVQRAGCLTDVNNFMKKYLRERRSLQQSRVEPPAPRGHGAELRAAIAAVNKAVAALNETIAALNDAE